MTLICNYRQINASIKKSFAYNVATLNEVDTVFIF